MAVQASHENQNRCDRHIKFLLPNRVLSFYVCRQPPNENHSMVAQTLWRSKSDVKTKTVVDRHIKFLLPSDEWKTMTDVQQMGRSMQ
jgi:hypothetical protein